MLVAAEQNTQPTQFAKNARFADLALTTPRALPAVRNCDRLRESGAHP